MLIELARNPQGPGYIVKCGEGRTAQIICNEAFEYFHEARQFAMSEANRRGCEIISNVTDDVPATKHTKTRALG